jgi:hypothetical protein
MRHYLFLILITISLSAYGEESSVFVPWKAPKHKTYHDSQSLAWKRAGFAFSDYLGIEGQRYAFNYQDRLRYSPADAPGFVDKSQQAVNFLGVGKLPISDAFAFFAKAGPSYYQPIDAENLSSSQFPNNQNMHDWGVSYSTGASLNLSPRVQLSLEYGHTEVDELEVEASTAQLSWSFQ